MKKIALITLIILIAITATIPTSGSGRPEVIPSYGNYALKEMGSYSNSSVKIGLIGNDTEFFHSNFNASYNKYPFYIKASNYYNASGIYFSSDSDNMSLNLSWNENESYSMTESYFMVSFGGQSISGCFGLKYNSDIAVKQGKNVDKLMKLSQNTFYTLSFTFTGQDVILMVHSMNTLYYSDSFQPTSSQTVSKDINLTIQGYYYNLFFEKPAFQDNKLTIYPSIINPHTIELKHQGLFSLKGKSKDFISDEEAGIYFVVNGNSSIVEYNPNSNMTGVIYSSSENNIITAVSDRGDTYWLIRNETDSAYCVEELNNSNLFMNLKKVPETPSGKFGIVIINNVLSFYNQTEVMEAVSDHVEFRYSNRESCGSAIEGISQYRGTTYVYYRNKTTLSILDQANGKVSHFGNFQSITNFSQEDGQLICGISFSTNAVSYYYPELEVISGRTINFMDRDEAGFTNTGEALDMLNISTQSQTFFQYTGNLSFIFSGSFISMSGNSYCLYLIDNSSSSDVKIKVPEDQLFSPLGYFNFTITGTSSFTSKLLIDGISNEGMNRSSYNLNLSSLNSGIYSYSLQILTASLYYIVHTGTVTVDSSFPNLTFSRSIKNGIFSGEVLWSKYSDSAGITQIVVDGVNNTINTVNSTISFLIPLHYAYKYLQFEVFFRDTYNVTRFIKFKLRYYDENGSGVFPDISENQIFNSNKLYITLRGNPVNVSRILFVVRNESFSKTLNYSSDITSFYLNLANGVYSISTYDLFSAGNKVFEGTVNFTVMSENLTVTDNSTVKSFYSFYGNSENDSFNFHYAASIKGMWNVRVYHNSVKDFTEKVGEENLWLNSSEIKYIFRDNGSFIFYLNYSSVNRHNYSSKLDIEVNNSIPYFIAPSYYYTNTSVLNLSKAFRSNGRIDYLMNGNMRIFNGSVYLNHTGNFSFIFHIWSRSMNHISRIIWVKFNTSAPEYKFIGFSSKVTRTSNLKLSVAANGKEHISGAFLFFNGREMNEKNFSFTLHFMQDGAYNFTLEVKDRCGNINRTTYYLNVTYYPLIRSIGVSYRIFFQSFIAQSILSGDNTSGIGIKWYINGNYASSGKYENISLPVGLDHISIRASYGNTTRSYSFTVISISSYFLVPVPIALFSIYALRNFPVNGNSEDLLNTIFSEDDSPLKEVIRKLRRKHFSRKMIKKSFNLLLERNLIKISPDPDGKPRLEILTNNKKK